MNFTTAIGSIEFSAINVTAKSNGQSYQPLVASLRQHGSSTIRILFYNVVAHVFEDPDRFYVTVAG